MTEIKKREGEKRREGGEWDERKKRKVRGESGGW